MELNELHKEIMSTCKYITPDKSNIIKGMLKIYSTYPNLRDGKLTIRKLTHLLKQESKLESTIRMLYIDNKTIFDKLTEGVNLKTINKDKLLLEGHFKTKLYCEGNMTYTKIFKALNLPNPKHRPRKDSYYYVLRRYVINYKIDLTRDKLFKLWETYKEKEYKLPEPTYGYVSNKLKVSKSLLRQNNILMSNIKKQYHEYNTIIDDHIRKARRLEETNRYHIKKIKDKKKRLQDAIIKSRTQMIYTKADVRPNKYLGVTYSQLKEHIEQQFKVDMSWDNYGRGKLWGLYYKVHPRTAKTKKDIIKLNNVSNLYPEYYRNIHKDRINNLRK